MALKRAIRLQCSECKRINYLSRKNQKANPDKLELNKYCKWCKKTTVHKETKDYRK